MKVELKDGRIFQVDYEWQRGYVGQVPLVEIVYDEPGENELYLSPRLKKERSDRGEGPVSYDPESWLDDDTIAEIEAYIIEHFDANDYYSDSDLDR